MQIARDIHIARPLEEVFAFVADPANDPAWCRKVLSVDQTEGDEPGPGARWRVVHRPVPLRPPREMEHACVDWQPPHRIQWREDDGSDRIVVTYRLEAENGGTRITQHDDADLGAPRLLRPIMRRGIAHDVDRQLRTLKRLLEHDNNHC